MVYCGYRFNMHFQAIRKQSSEHHMLFQSAHYKHQALKRSSSVSSWGITDVSGKLPVLTRATAAFAHVSQRTFCVPIRNFNCTKTYHWKQKKMPTFITYFIFSWLYPHRSFTFPCFLSFCQNDQEATYTFKIYVLYTYFIYNSTFLGFLQNLFCVGRLKKCLS